MLLFAFCPALLLLSTLVHRRWLGTCLDFSTHKCRVILGYCTDEARKAEKVRLPAAIYIHAYKQKEEVSQNKFQRQILEGQVYVPSLEPTAPIRLADRNHAHYPSRHCTILKKRRLGDGLPAHAIQSRRQSSKVLTRTLDPPPSKVRSDIFPHSLKGNQSDG